MLAATDRPVFRTGFGPMPIGFEHVPFGDMEALYSAMGSHVAAIMIESVQGEGGAKQVPDQYLVNAREAADKFGALLIADEVQTGIGRTGHLFSFEESGIKPDIIAVAKGLAGGFPIGAVIASKKVGSSMTPGTHGSTFGGNPLAMVTASTVLDVLTENGFMQGVRERAAYLDSCLQKLHPKFPSIISEIRGRGFLRGICLVEDIDLAALVKALRDDHVLCVPSAENTLRLLPPLIINCDEIDILMASLHRQFDAFEQRVR